MKRTSNVQCETTSKIFIRDRQTNRQTDGRPLHYVSTRRGQPNNTNTQVSNELLTSGKSSLCTMPKQNNIKHGTFVTVLAGMARHLFVSKNSTDEIIIVDLHYVDGVFVNPIIGIGNAV